VHICFWRALVYLTPKYLILAATQYDPRVVRRCGPAGGLSARREPTPGTRPHGCRIDEDHDL